MNAKELISIFTIGLAIVSYTFYFRDILKKGTKPHAFTWLIWGLLNGITFTGQLSAGGGAGSWPLGFTALAMLCIFVFALLRGEKDIRPFDWFCLVAAILSIVPWLLTNDPVWSIVLVTLIDLLGFLPTVRKVIKKPFEETLITHAINTFKYLLILLALENYNLATSLFPATILVADFMLVLLIVNRRKTLAATKSV